jgi:hypothetical protein
LHASHLTAARDGKSRWWVSLPWQTRVFGLIPRDVDEHVRLQIVRHPDLWEVIVRCRPIETHGAHATGIAAVLFIAVCVWIASGLPGGVLPAVTTPETSAARCGPVVPPRSSKAGDPSGVLQSAGAVSSLMSSSGSGRSSALSRPK